MSPEGLVFDETTLVDHLQGLALIANDLYIVVAADTHSITIQPPDKSAENIFCRSIAKMSFPHKNEGQATRSVFHKYSTALPLLALYHSNIFALEGSFFKKKGIGSKSASFD